jgi:hypothetical protein
MPVNVEMSNKADQQTGPPFQGLFFYKIKKEKVVGAKSLLAYNNQSSQMLNSGQNDEECDATDDHSSNTARLINIFLFLRGFYTLKR